MTLAVNRRWLGGALSLLFLSHVDAARANPTAEDALKLQPVQKDIEFDRPKDTTGAKIEAKQFDGKTGWIVSDAAGNILRRFVDTNGDNLVDQWCYYSAGSEVYRDIDANHDGKADQYRWLNTGGTRWGIDNDQDGRIDQWKMISAEEVTAEVVKAIGEGDVNRFKRLLITSAEVTSLGLGKQQSDEVTKLAEDAPTRFRSYLGDQKSPGAKLASTGSKLRWLQMGVTVPGIVPAGTDGSTKDVLAYENVLAMVEADGKHQQIAIGTLVKVDNAWRIVDAPHESDEVADAGVIIKGPTSKAEAIAGGNSGRPPQDIEKIVAKIQEIDTRLAKATPADVQHLNAERADLVEKLAETTSGEEQKSWYRQFADTVSVAAQSGGYSAGVERLKKLAEKLTETDKDLAAYVHFRYLTADYYSNIQEPNANFAAVQAAWLDNLKKFVENHPKAADTAEALLQLGIAEEFSGNDEAAKAWYAKGAALGGDQAPVKKAAGALVRLNSVGRVLNLTSNTTDGKQAALSNYKGKVIVLYYWASWCQPFQNDMPALRELQAKYARDLVMVGANLDEDLGAAQSFLKQHRLPWTHLWEKGGLDSSLANSLGIVTVPTIILIDKQGRIVNQGIQVNQLDKEIGALVK